MSHPEGTESPLPGVLVVPLRSFEDERGRFVETYREAWFPDRPAMLQSNRSDSKAGVLRGLHFHRKQADYWVVARGRIQVGLADLRPGSPTHLQAATFELGEADSGVYIPPGVAHGFLALNDAALTYQVDQHYDGSDELGWPGTTRTWRSRGRWRGAS